MKEWFRNLYLNLDRKGFRQSEIRLVLVLLAVITTVELVQNSLPKLRNDPQSITHYKNQFEDIKRELDARRDSIIKAQYYPDELAVTDPVSVDKTTKSRDINTELIDINSAGPEELITLPGVGEKTAQAIIALRSQKKFEHVDDLLNVKGIGAKKLNKIKPYITIE